MPDHETGTTGYVHTKMLSKCSKECTSDTRARDRKHWIHSTRDVNNTGREESEWQLLSSFGIHIIVLVKLSSMFYHTFHQSCTIPFSPHSICYVRDTSLCVPSFWFGSGKCFIKALARSTTTSVSFSSRRSYLKLKTMKCVKRLLRCPCILTARISL